MHHCRVFVRFNPKGSENQVLKEQGNPDLRPKLKGTVYTLDKEEKIAIDAMAPKGSLKEPSKMLIVQYNQEPAPLGVIICVGVCFVLVGLLFFLPFGFWLLRTLRRAPASGQGPGVS
jgi:hypothetical protein